MTKAELQARVDELELEAKEAVKKEGVYDVAISRIPELLVGNPVQVIVDLTEEDRAPGVGRVILEARLIERI